MSSELVLLGGVVALFAVTLYVFRSMLQMQLEATREMQDGMSKLAQLGFIHVGSKTPMDAVAATTVLANEMAALERAEGLMGEELARSEKSEADKRGPPVGFRGPNGAVVKFMDDATRDRVAAKVPPDRLVYKS